MIKHINEIKLEVKDKFTEQFNLCSEYFQKSEDQSLSVEDREKYSKLWFEERQRLEFGIY